MAQPVTGGPTRDGLTQALRHWHAGERDPAIELARTLADEGSLPGLLTLGWFYTGSPPEQLREIAPYVRRALDEGLVLPGLWHLGAYISDPDTVDLALDVIEAASDGVPFDGFGHWQTLWANGYEDAAVRLVEAMAEPEPSKLRQQWIDVLSEARTGAEEITKSVGAVESSRDTAVADIRHHEEAIRSERNRVESLVQETTNLVHTVAAGHIAEAYSDRARSTQSAARLWTFFAVVVGLAGAAWAGYVAYHAFQNDQDLQTITGKALVSLPILLVAGYLANVAANNRRMAWHWSHVELQIRTAEPFIAVLDEETRLAILAALAIRFFPGQGQDPQSHHGTTNESIDIGALLSQVMDAMPARKPTSTPTPPPTPPDTT